MLSCTEKARSSHSNIASGINDEKKSVWQHELWSWDLEGYRYGKAIIDYFLITNRRNSNNIGRSYNNTSSSSNNNKTRNNITDTNNNSNFNSNSSDSNNSAIKDNNNNITATSTIVYLPRAAIGVAEITIKRENDINQNTCMKKSRKTPTLYYSLRPSSSTRKLVWPYFC